MEMFERPHHQRISTVLYALDGCLLLENNCLFGGGTAIALRHGEYRESVDIDFLVSDVGNYRNLRQLLTGANGIAAIVRSDDGVFGRDVIDLAMMAAPIALLRLAVAKAEGAYGSAILRDLQKALQRFQDRQGWLERCMQAMSMNLPKALVWKRLRALCACLPKDTGADERCV